MKVDVVLSVGRHKGRSGSNRSQTLTLCSFLPLKSSLPHRYLTIISLLRVGVPYLRDTVSTISPGTTRCCHRHYCSQTGRQVVQTKASKQTHLLNNSYLKRLKILNFFPGNQTFMYVMLPPLVISLLVLGLFIQYNVFRLNPRDTSIP